MQNGVCHHWPEAVGIVDIEIYFPNVYVEQADLERFDGVSSGKYTVGLGQSAMGFCTDREDIHSLCMTVVQRLLTRTALNPSRIGRLEVGTETLVDKSKSVKSVLMQLFEPAGVNDVEGVDSTNACFGGTQALFNAVNWVESSSWDGRLALVVMGDIAVYASGPARCTGGAGAVALLVGPNAPLIFDRGLRAVYMRHTYDFYKPDLTSEYPLVDGKLSLQCYMQAVDACYQLYCKKAEKTKGQEVSLESFDGMLFHTPFCRLVQKALARMFYLDERRRGWSSVNNLDDSLKCLTPNEVLMNDEVSKKVEKIFLDASAAAYEKLTAPSLLLARLVGNMYTPSLYAALISFLISKPTSELCKQRIGLFSYGSGLAASMFSLTVTDDANKLERLVAPLTNVPVLLSQRHHLTPQQFADVLEARANAYGKCSYKPEASLECLVDGVYYLTDIDEKYRRTYAMKGPAAVSSSAAASTATESPVHKQAKLQP